ncbi:MAG: hypothetical protein WCY19_04010 [Candidatus Gastranaerophilaceae bacterium]
MTKKYKNSVPLDDFMVEYLQDKERAKGFLNASLESYLDDSDINEFLHSLELVLKSRQSVLSFAKETKLSRTNLYVLFKGKRTPNMHTVLKILAKLGYTLKVA